MGAESLRLLHKELVLRGEGNIKILYSIIFKLYNGQTRNSLNIILSLYVND